MNTDTVEAKPSFSVMDLLHSSFSAKVDGGEAKDQHKGKSRMPKLKYSISKNRVEETLTR